MKWLRRICRRLTLLVIAHKSVFTSRSTTIQTENRLHVLPRAMVAMMAERLADATVLVRALAI
jgi:hypothetical protein